MDKFENKLKSKLLNKNMELDIDELWGEVYPHIKKKKRRFIVFYFLGLLLLATVGTLLYYTQGNESSLITKHGAEEQSEIAFSQTQIASKKSIEESDQSPIVNESELVLKYSENYNSSGLADLNRKEDRTIQKNTRSGSQPIKKTSIVKTPYYEDKGIKNNVNLNKLKKEQQLNKNIAKQLALNTAKENDIQEYEYLKLKPLVSQIDALNFQDRKLIKTPIHDFQSSYRNQKSNFSLFGTLGGAMMNKQLATRDGASSEHLQRRLSNEKSLESIDASLGFNYALKENFEISLGLNFRRMNERISDTYTRVDTVLLENVVIENIISSRGTEPVYGDVLASRTIETNLEAYNRYNELSAFVDFRYLLGVQRWRPYASLGYQHSVYSSQSGYWLWEENLYDIKNDEEDYISTSYSPAVRIGLGLDFNFSENASFRFEGRFLKYVNSITNDSYPLSQKYTLIGLQTGLNIKL